MYSSRDRSHLRPLKGIISGLAAVNQRFGGNLSFLGAVGMPPSDVTIVARAVIAAIVDETIQGIVDIDRIDSLGT